ncbi:MAG: hypothetical protein ACQEXX_03855 [Bacillota bacterium]
MIKNRVFMLGLGIGLVVGAVLLQLMLMGERAMSSSQPQDKQWTQEQIEEAAKAMDMKVVNSSEELMTEEQWKEKMKNESGKMTGTAVKPPSKATETKQADSPQTPEKPGDVKKDPAAPAVKDPTSPKEPDSTKIRYVISGGSNLSDVANGLQKAGVIEDKQAFIDEATAQKINKFIQRGTYTFTAGEELDSIIQKITEKPSNSR